ncbi:MAG TPA: Dabb family protein [Solirubrobacterales bacterium]|nr:Dabb family protein [Solirubrobacterales bacterium]
MIQHIALLKLKPGVTDEQVEAAFEAGSDLPNEIPGVLRLTYGRDRSDPAHGFGLASVVQLQDEEALNAYLKDPRRLEYLESHVDPLTEERIELAVPLEGVHAPTIATWYWGIGGGLD